MLLYFGSKSMMPAASSVVCESAHTCSAFAHATNRTYVRGAARALLRTVRRRRDGKLLSALHDVHVKVMKQVFAPP